MQGIHRRKALIHESRRLRHRLIRHRNPFFGEPQQRLHTASPVGIWIPPEFEFDDFAGHPRVLASRNQIEDESNCIGFHSDSKLRLIVKGTIQAADVQVDLHASPQGSPNV